MAVMAWSYDQELEMPDPSILIALTRRGGDTSGASPPPSEDKGSSIPEIGGSSAGFIALVVVLSSIVLISCIAVFFLLRHKPDPYERHARRVLAGKRDAVNYEVPTGPPGIKARVKGMFKPGKRSQGWMRASSGDDGEEWDAADLVRESDAEMVSRASPPPPSFTPPSRPPQQRSMTSDSIELSAPPMEIPFNLTAISIPTTSTTYRDPYNPYTTSPTAMVSSETVAEHRPQREPSMQKQPGHSSVDSAGSTRTFESGSKFREDLDFN